MDNSRAVFNGMIKVAPHALKTDGQMTNNNLLLGRKAEIDTKPQLEIYADDVKCSHGATVGRIDEEQLFYLRTRGIAEKAAKQMIILAFAAELTDAISDEVLNNVVMARIRQSLDQGINSNELFSTTAAGRLPGTGGEVNGKPLVYLDSAASAQKPQQVIDAVSDFTSHHYAAVHRGIHTLSAEATAATEAVRQKAAVFINAPQTEEIILSKAPPKLSIWWRTVLAARSAMMVTISLSLRWNITPILCPGICWRRVRGLRSVYCRWRMTVLWC